MSEQYNIANEQAEVRDRLQAQLEAWLEENQAPMPKSRAEDMQK
jgi:hypothetical protein